MPFIHELIMFFLPGSIPPLLRSGGQAPCTGSCFAQVWQRLGTWVWQCGSGKPSTSAMLAEMNTLCMIYVDRAHGGKV